MSILSSLFQSLTGNSGNSESTERPCSNCPSTCTDAPNACSECAEYKNLLLDKLYYVEHIDDYYDSFEVVGDNAASNAADLICPYCTAPVPANSNSCEYCGMAVRDTSGAKTPVAKASDIPNPILEAQDIIFDRQELLKKYRGNNAGGISDVINSLFSDSAASSDLGSKMSEDEIRSTAQAYGVSVADYLQGLDNGVYLNAARKKAADAAPNYTVQSTAVPTSPIYYGQNVHGYSSGRQPSQARPMPPHNHGGRPDSPQRPAESRPSPREKANPQREYRQHTMQQNNAPKENNRSSSRPSTPAKGAPSHSQRATGNQSSGAFSRNNTFSGPSKPSGSGFQKRELGKSSHSGNTGKGGPGRR